MDLSAPPDILSARSSPGVSRRPSVKAGQGMDGPLVGGLEGALGKESDNAGGDIEQRNVAKTVTYGYTLPRRATGPMALTRTLTAFAPVLEA